jgi:DNA-binding MarR family transcriptional regulator
MPNDFLAVPALVQRLANQGIERLRHDLADQGMGTVRPAHVLVLLPLLGGGRRASDLATLLGVSRQAVAQVVGALETGGYVERLDDPGDARAKLVCLTAPGRAALRAVRASAVAVEAEWADRLGADRLAEFRATLTELLTGPPGAGPPDS